MKIQIASSPSEIELARTLFREYQKSLGIDLCFQGFEIEMAGLPGQYAPPEGRLYLAFEADQAMGCAAFRRIESGVCELKRLYVRPAYRGRGLGRRLALEAVKDAREIGYGRMRLDTLPSMLPALDLYRALGFKPIEPYNNNPVEGAVFLELNLR